MRAFYVWEDGYCAALVSGPEDLWSDDNAGDEEEILDERREALLESACPACGQRYRECVCNYDPFEGESDGNPASNRAALCGDLPHLRRAGGPSLARHPGHPGRSLFPGVEGDGRRADLSRMPGKGVAAVKSWRHYMILVRGFGGWPSPDDREGHQERYATLKEAMRRATLLWASGKEPFVEVHEMTDRVIMRWPSEESDG
jgi:hypothetical protein